MPVGTIHESQMGFKIKKRESEHSSLTADATDVTDYEKLGVLSSQKGNALLINNRSSSEQQVQDTVVPPFVHTGKAELHVHIEKIPANVSSFIINRTDCSVRTCLYSTVSPKYGTIDETPNFNVTNVEIAPNFYYTENKTDNLTMKTTLKKPDYGNDFSNQETNNSGNTLHNSESLSANFNSLGMENNLKNEKYDYANKISAKLSDKNMKSRAKRNQEVASKCYLRSDRNTRSKRFKNAEQRTSSGNMKHKKTRHRRIRCNRAARSIGEIKELAEKLIIKVRNY